LPKLKVYQVHSATFESAVLQNTAVLQYLFQLKKEFGLQLGLTVSGPKQKELLLEASELCLDNAPLFDSFQVTYNLFEQAAFEVLKLLKGAGRFLIVKEGLANGRIFLPTKTRKTLEGLALKYQVGIDAIALRFCMDAVGPNVVLSGAASSEQLTQNLCALNFQLTPSEIEQLKGAKMPTETYWHERSQLPWG
jgi:aryl-alcohol dehydrogenase-like predicted oxidoreductase